MTYRNKGLLLRTVRTSAAIICGSLLTWVIVSAILWSAPSAGLIHDFASRLEGLQFIPAAFAFSLTTVIGWVLVTLIFGRIYCSTVCPLGLWQDIFARLPRLSPYGRRHRYYRYSRPLTPWRTASILAFFIGVFAGIPMLIAILDPWQIYSDLLTRTASIFRADPALRLATAASTGSIISLTIITIVSILAFRNGRTFCNSLCPVGSALGCVSRYSLLHIDIDTDLCTNCGQCEDVCKAACINLADHLVDGSRCVNCFNCLTVCPNEGAIRYTSSRKALSTPLMQRTTPSISN